MLQEQYDRSRPLSSQSLGPGRGEAGRGGPGRCGPGRGGQGQTGPGRGGPGYGGPRRDGPDSGGQSSDRSIFAKLMGLTLKNLN